MRDEAEEDRRLLIAMPGGIDVVARRINGGLRIESCTRAARVSEFMFGPRLPIALPRAVLDQLFPSTEALTAAVRAATDDRG